MLHELTEYFIEMFKDYNYKFHPQKCIKCFSIDIYSISLESSTVWKTKQVVVHL